MFGILRKLWPYLRPYRKRLLLAAVGVLAFNALAMAPPLVFRYLIDEVVQKPQWSLMGPIVLIYAILPMGYRLVSFANVLNIVFVGQRLVTDLRLGMYRLALRLGMQYHGQTSAGALIARLMGDVNIVGGLVTGQAVSLLADVVVLGVALGVAYAIHAGLATMLVGTMALYAATYHFYVTRIRDATQTMQEVNDVVLGRLQETLSGVRQVRIYGREPDERETFLLRAGRYLERAFAVGIYNVSLRSACGLIGGYGSTFIYCLAGYYIFEGQMTLGDLIAINSYVWMALNPALRLTAFAGQLARAAVSIRRIFDVLDQDREIASPPGAPDIRCPDGRVEFQDVHFSYKPDEPLFEGLDLIVPAGKTVALVGRTGCGKTTITSLMMRLWDVRKGRILIDGTDIRTVRVKSLRTLFGVVPQDPIVFEGTLAENIAYGKPDATRDQIAAAAEVAEVLEFARRLPDGLDAVLGTDGVQLSRGQKQRVSIARAILKEPKILMLDEATSALDSNSEALIQTALERVLRGRTSFVVAHRLSTVVHADMIVVMDQGRIIQQGTHEELLAEDGGAYRKLYDQLRGGERGTDA